MTTFIIAGIIIYILTAIMADLWGKRDADKKNEDINHKKNMLIRLIFGVPVAILLNFGFMKHLFVFNQFDSYFRVGLGSVFYLAILASIYWIVFDISFALHRKLPYDYIGNTAEFDKKERKLIKNGTQILRVKVAIFAISTVFYYLWMFHKS